MSGFAVTICFSTGRNLFCLNSISPVQDKRVLGNTQNFSFKDINNFLIGRVCRKATLNPPAPSSRAKLSFA